MKLDVIPKQIQAKICAAIGVSPLVLHAAGRAGLRDLRQRRTGREAHMEPLAGDPAQPSRPSSARNSCPASIPTRGSPAAGT